MGESPFDNNYSYSCGIDDCIHQLKLELRQSKERVRQCHRTFKGNYSSTFMLEEATAQRALEASIARLERLRL